MSAPPSGSSGSSPSPSSPAPGYYPDPSIPNYIRYWNGSAWVPGTSRPAPVDATPENPAGGVAPAAQWPVPEGSAPQGSVPETSGPAGGPPAQGSGHAVPGAPGVAVVPAGRAVDESGPMFLDEDPRAPRAETGPAGLPQQAGPGESGGGFGPHAGPGHVGSGQAGSARPGAVEPGHGQGQDGGGPGLPDAGGAARDPRAGQGEAPAWPSMDRPGPQLPRISWGAEQARPGAQPPAHAGGQAPQALPGQAGAQPREALGAGPAAQASPQAPLPAQSQSGRLQPAQPGGVQPQPGQQQLQPGQPHAGQPQQLQPGQPSALQPGALQPHPAAQVLPAQPMPRQAQPPAQDRSALGPQPGAGGPGAGGPAGSAQAAGGAQAAAPWAAQVHDLAQPPWRPVPSDPFGAAQRLDRPGGLVRRFAARVIDAVLLIAITGAAAVPLGTAAYHHAKDKVDQAKLTGETVKVWLLDGTTGAELGAVVGVLLVAGLLLEVLPTAKWGRTLGKKLVGLKVLDIEGQLPPGFGASLRRWLTRTLLHLTVVGVIGTAWCLFDRPWKQGLQDKAARTFVAGV
ncbi:RDD family protein [Actinacidiphila acidipaludis]|uniref:RDD family protein n=1 Tax=Actinacidiphila acidipaludis TaxID=2873382 RepID=A0ABS7Q803_9ACTN|nr:RDD family protein [Streptomyces acidipaludis]MBY8879280.1 RDD family protein [Streptomyces acidipaludis]